MSHLPPQEQYDLGWERAEQLQWWLRARADFGNRFGIYWRNFVAFRLAHFTRDIRGWLLKIEVEGDMPPPSPKRRAPLVLAVHTRVSFAAEAMEELGHTPALMRDANTARSLASGASHFKGNEHLTQTIPVDANVLLNIRKQIQAGNAVVSYIDFTRRDPYALTHRRYLSTSLLEYARRTKTDLMFSASRLLPDNRVSMRFLYIDGKTSSHSLQELIDMLLAFHAAHSDTPGNWQIVGTPQEAPALKHQMHDLWIPSAP